MLLYSDGFIECRLKNGEMLEESGLIGLVARCTPGRTGREFLDELYWNLTQVMDRARGLEDDVSATLFEYNGP